MNAHTPTTEQTNIINFETNLVVVAKPGSGKTYVLSEKVREKIAGLPDYKGVIAISYTNKATRELMQRCKKDALDVKKSFFGTIDKFCNSEIIIPFLPQIWGKPRKEIEIEKVSELPKEEKDLFLFVKENKLAIEELIPNIDLVKKYFLAGRLLLETTGALALYVLQNSKSCRNYMKARYTHVFIDEYQDSGVEQHNIFLEMVSLGLIGVAVGDAEQSIFGFSGKSSEYLLELCQNNKFQTFPLNLNHRCHNSIVNYSLALFNPNINMLPIDEKRVYLKTVSGNQVDIAAWIDKNIPKIITHFQVANASSIGILVRGNNTGEIVSSSLTVKHRFFRATPLEEHFSLWGKLFTDLLNFKFEKKVTTEEIIENYTYQEKNRKKVKSLRSLFAQFKECSNDRIQTQGIEIASIMLPNATNNQAITLFGEVIATPEYLQSFTPPDEDEVQLLTIHKAKGLEFDVVFHLDLYDWVFPFKQPGPNKDWNNPIYPSWDQDLNLHYVAVTRAKKACILCSSTSRINAAGEEKRGSLSQFLSLPKLCEIRAAC